MKTKEQTQEKASAQPENVREYATLDGERVEVIGEDSSDKTRALILSARGVTSYVAKTELEASARQPVESARVDSVEIQWKTDSDPDLSYLEQFKDSTDLEEQKYAKQDEARLESYGRMWEMLGCVAKAEVSYDIGNGNRRIEWLTSGGLWGIESDSDEEYRFEIENEQLADLVNHLAQFGIETTFEELRQLAG